MMIPNAAVKCYSFHIHYMLYANEANLFTGLGQKLLRFFPVVRNVNQV